MLLHTGPVLQLPPLCEIATFNIWYQNRYNLVAIMFACQYAMLPRKYLYPRSKADKSLPKADFSYFGAQANF